MAIPGGASQEVHQGIWGGDGAGQGACQPLCLLLVDGGGTHHQGDIAAQDGLLSASTKLKGM